MSQTQNDTVENKTPGDVYRSLGADAQKWALYYLQTVRQVPPPVMTEEFMTTWFASAIMAGYDAGLLAAKRDIDAKGS